jgi:hypothetical protein
VISSSRPRLDPGDEERDEAVPELTSAVATADPADDFRATESWLGSFKQCGAAGASTLFRECQDIFSQAMAQ